MTIKISNTVLSSGPGTFILADDTNWDPNTCVVESLIVIRIATEQEKERDALLWRADRFFTSEKIDETVGWDNLTDGGRHRIRRVVALIFHEAVKVC